MPFQETPEERLSFLRVRKAENNYSLRLRKLANHINDLIYGFITTPQYPRDLNKLEKLLTQYAEIVTPWATAVASRFLADVARRDEQAWKRYTKKLSQALKEEINNDLTGAKMREFLATQVQLITSIPLEAAQRVHEIAIDNLHSGELAPDLIADIMETGNIARGRAKLIARTETARVASTLTMVRAQSIGSKGYIWRTARDAQVRPEHRKMQDVYCEWHNPPQVEPNKRYHAGMIYNCFVGETLVDWSAAKKLFRVFYNGPLISLKIGGTIVETTPNHPMLTDRGWVAAELLQEGDNIATMPFESNIVRDDQEYKCISTFDELFKTWSPESCQSISGSRFDFYGDIIDGDVDYIVFDPVLGNEWDARFLQQEGNFSLPKADCWITDVLGCSNLQIEGALAPSLLNLLSSLKRGSLISNKLIGCSLISELYPLLEQEIANSHTSHTIPSGKSGCSQSIMIEANDFFCGKVEIPALPRAQALSHGSVYTQASQFLTESIRCAPNTGGSVKNSHPGSYLFSCLENKSFRNFSGHVYTLETTTGQYGVGPNRIQAKNCRCWPDVVVPDEYLPEGFRTKKRFGKPAAWGNI